MFERKEDVKTQLPKVLQRKKKKKKNSSDGNTSSTVTTLPKAPHTAEIETCQEEMRKLITHVSLVH